MILIKVNDERECFCDTKVIRYCNKETLIHESIHIALFRVDCAYFGDESVVKALELFIIGALNSGVSVQDAVDVFFSQHDETMLDKVTRISSDITTNLKKAGYLQ